MISTSQRSASKVVVVGSINMDLVVRCRTLPTPGQTVFGESCDEYCGGKGANQAVAASRCGAAVSMIGRVGRDGFADALTGNLVSNQVNVDAVLNAGPTSGMALISVEEGGQNSIVVVPGANALLDVQDIENVRSLIADSDIVMLQLEIPMDVVLSTIRIAAEESVPVVLDPAPAPKSWPAEMLNVDLVCPNESEAAQLTGRKIDTIDDAISCSRDLHQMGASNVVVTMGSRGTVLLEQDEPTFVAPLSIQAVDTTAAGDAFAGALAAMWSGGSSLTDAVNFANAAGAWSATQHGAQASMGTRNQIETLRKR